jgi:hypothetical protein
MNDAHVVRKQRRRWVRLDALQQRGKPFVFTKGWFRFWVEVSPSACKNQSRKSFGIFDRSKPLKEDFDTPIDVPVGE